jgi:hypothetical protein
MIIRVFKSTRMEWPGYVARMGKKRNTYVQDFGEKNEGKKPLEKTESR